MDSNEQFREVASELLGEQDMTSPRIDIELNAGTIKMHQNGQQQNSRRGRGCKREAPFVIQVNNKENDGKCYPREAPIFSQRLIGDDMDHPADNEAAVNNLGPDHAHDPNVIDIGENLGGQ